MYADKLSRYLIYWHPLRRVESLNSRAYIAVGSVRYVTSPTLKTNTDKMQLSGTVLLIIFVSIVLLSLPYVRTKLYEVFKIVHITLAIFFVILLFWHIKGENICVRSESLVLFCHIANSYVARLFVWLCRYSYSQLCRKDNLS